MWPRIRAAIRTGRPALDAATRRRDHLLWGLSQADRVVLVGTPLRNYFARFLREEQIAVISNGFRIPASLVPSHRIPRAAHTRVVSVSNLHHNKGVDISIKALAALVMAGHRDLEVVMVGDGEERSSLERMTTALGLKDRVHFTGYLPHREALAEIAAADIFCLPSWREACGIAHIEAMALGKLVIGCRGQGPSDFITHGEAGFLVEPHDVYGLADALACASDVRIRQRIGAKASQFIKQNFTWHYNAMKIANLYNSLLVDARQRRR
jgi:teichuronic acid biosynthesis glycosyltransferase TuaC